MVTAANYPWRLRVAVAFAAILAVLGLAVWIGVRPARADFTLTAETGILRLQTYCVQRLVWDLPLGTVTQPGEILPPDESDAGSKSKDPDAHVSLEMDGHALIAVSRSAAGNLLVVVQRGEGADDSRPMGTVTTSHQHPESRDDANKSSQAILRKLYYQSTSNEPDFTLPVWGRVTVGDDVPQGSGSEAGAAPLLREATVRARVRLQGGINQGVPRKTVIDESVDAGDIVDTHPELMDRPFARDELRNYCARQEENWAAVGFVAPGSGAGLLKLVVHRNATAFSITRASARPFALSVPTWHVWIASPAVQIAAAFSVLLFGLFAIGDNFWSSRELWLRIFRIGK